MYGRAGYRKKVLFSSGLRPSLRTFKEVKTSKALQVQIKSCLYGKDVTSRNESSYLWMVLFKRNFCTMYIPPPYRYTKHTTAVSAILAECAKRKTFVFRLNLPHIQCWVSYAHILYSNSTSLIRFLPLYLIFIPQDPYFRIQINVAG
jgi:hypothetical protein